jgi:uncharacterized membrane protein
MTRIAKQVVIERPVNEVLGFAREWRNIPRYFDYIQELEPLSERTEGEGARYLVKLKFLGRAMTSEWETVEYMDNEGWTFLTPLMGVAARKRWRFESLGGSTRVSFALEYEPRPVVLGPMLDVLLLRRQWNKLCERGIQNFKRLVEAEAPKAALPA